VHLMEELQTSAWREGGGDAAPRIVAPLPARRAEPLLEPVQEAGDRGKGGDAHRPQRAAHPTILSQAARRRRPATSAAATPAKTTRQACMGRTYRNSKCTMDCKAAW